MSAAHDTLCLSCAIVRCSSAVDDCALDSVRDAENMSGVVVLAALAVIEKRNRAGAPNSNASPLSLDRSIASPPCFESPAERVCRDDEEDERGTREISLLSLLPSALPCDSITTAGTG